MTYTDAFLVEKLREILLRLYPTPIANPVRSHLAPRNSFLDNKLSPVVETPRSNYTTYIEDLGDDDDADGNIGGVSDSNINEDDYTSVLFLNEGRHSNISGSNNSSTTSGGEYDNNDIGIVHNVSSSERAFSDDFFIVGNYSLQPQPVPPDSLHPLGQANYPNSVFSSTTTTKDNEYDTTALTRNLQEFIQVLKMSLHNPSNNHGNGIGGGSGSNGNGYNSIVGDSGGGNVVGPYGDGTFTTGGGGLRDSGMTAIGMGMGVGSFGSGGGGVGMQSHPHEETLSGVTVSNSPDMEFNLTLDDIADLNNLLDGSGSSLQFRHFLIIFAYFLIACVSIVGNLLVVQLVIRSRRLHTLTHALLANLAVADLFMATLNIPFSAARVILSEWPFGSILCHVVPFAQVTSVYVTSITMAVIAIDRYSVIMNPLGSRMKSSQGVILVLAIWALSALLSLPYAIHHKVVTVLTVRVVSRCQADFGSLWSRRWLTVATFLAQYLIPLLFTTVSYVSIMQRLRNRSSALGSTTPRQVAAQSRAKKKTIKMLVLTVVFFAVSWAPINIYHLLTHFSLVRHDSTAILICHLIAMSSCTVNPFIYCWFNEHFRREALKWVRCFRTRRCPIVHPAVEINGMLTRADRVCHRTQSTTLVHTASIRRSPQLSHSQQFYQGSERMLTLGGPSSRLACSYSLNLRNFNNSTMGGDHLDHATASPMGYRPETLFLARRTSLDDIFADHAAGELREARGEDEPDSGCVAVVVRDVDQEKHPGGCGIQNPEIKENEGGEKENCEDFKEKPTVLNRHEGVSISVECHTCKMDKFEGICVSSEESGDQV